MTVKPHDNLFSNELHKCLYQMKNSLYASYMSAAYAVSTLYLAGEKQLRPNQTKYTGQTAKVVSRLIGALPALLELSSETGMQR